MRLTKEEFCNAIDTYQEMYDQLKEIEDTLNIGPENRMSKWIHSYLDLIEDLCDFKEENYTKEFGTAVDYYCFETDFGRNNLRVTNSKKEVVPLKTSEDLWNLLMEELDIENCS